MLFDGVLGRHFEELPLIAILRGVIPKQVVEIGEVLVEAGFRIIEIPLNLDNDNNVLVKNLWTSVDPYMRTRMTDKKNYIAPFEIGKPMEGSAIGEVLESKSKLFNKDITFSSFCLIYGCSFPPKPLLYLYS